MILLHLVNSFVIFSLSFDVWCLPFKLLMPDAVPGDGGFLGALFRFLIMCWFVMGAMRCTVALAVKNDKLDSRVLFLSPMDLAKAIILTPFITLLYPRDVWSKYKEKKNQDRQNRKGR